MVRHRFYLSCKTPLAECTQTFESQATSKATFAASGRYDSSKRPAIPARAQCGLVAEVANAVGEVFIPPLSYAVVLVYELYGLTEHDVVKITAAHPKRPAESSRSLIGNYGRP